MSCKAITYVQTSCGVTVDLALVLVVENHSLHDRDATADQRIEAAAGCAPSACHRLNVNYSISRMDHQIEELTSSEWQGDGHFDAVRRSRMYTACALDYQTGTKYWKSKYSITVLIHTVCTLSGLALRPRVKTLVTLADAQRCLAVASTTGSI